MIKIITGDTATFTFFIVYSGAVDSMPTPDLSEATVVFALKNGKREISKEIVSPPTNVASFTLTAEETATLPSGVYESCCKIYYNNGEAITAWSSSISVIKGVLGANKPQY